MKILVTGAAGFIGSHMCERLAKGGYQVVGIDSFNNHYDTKIKKINARDLASCHVNVLSLDLATDNIDDITKNVDVIFHFAAQPGISNTTTFESYERNNIIATKRLLDAARASRDLKGFINIATSSIYGKHATDNEDAAPKPISVYGVTKLAAEQLVLAEQRENNFPGLSLRLFSVCGERERPEKLYHKLIKTILEDEEFPLFKGSRDHVRSFTYVGDIIDGCMLVLEKLDQCIGEIINLGTDKTNTTGEGINIIEDIIGKKARFEMLPPRPGDQKETAADIKKARQLLGYNPTTSLREALEHEVMWYKEKIHGKL